MTTLIKKTILAAPIAAIATLGFTSAAFAATPSLNVNAKLVPAKVKILTTGTHLKANTKVANLVHRATPHRTVIRAKRNFKGYTPIYKVTPKVYGKSYSYGYKPIYSSKFKPVVTKKVIVRKRAY